MKRILLVICCVVFAFQVEAQQDPQITQNMFNRQAINPAYAGSTECIEATLISRQQWMGFEGNPKTNIFSSQGGFRVRQQYQMGAGLSIIQDEIGPIQSLNVKGALAYHHRINQGVLSFGVEFGMFNQSINGVWRTSEGNFDGTEDPSIPNAETGVTNFDLGLGLYYRNTDGLYVGLSTTHLNQSTFKDEVDDNSSLTFNQATNYYIMAGYNYPISLSNGAELELQPSIFVKTDAVSSQVDLNTNVMYNNLLWAGVSYRMQDAVSFLTGVNIGEVVQDLDGLRIGLAYDFNTSALSDYNDGSFEFMLTYCYKIKKVIKLERYKSVRFL